MLQMGTPPAPIPQATFFNLVGADSFLSLRRWRSPGRLLGLAEWIVVTRPGYPLTESDLTPLTLTPAQRARVHILAGVAENVSAKNLRNRLHGGDRCLDLIPESVATYIHRYRLYS